MQPSVGAQPSPAASKSPFMKGTGPHSSAMPSTEAQQHSHAGSDSASIQGARSQEGDFFRLLDSHRPAPRASLQDSDLQQLPRSFSTREKGRVPAPSAALPEGSDERQDASSKVADAWQEEDTVPAVAVEARGQQGYASALPGGDVGTARQQVLGSSAAQGEAAPTALESETPEGLQACDDSGSRAELPASAPLLSKAGPASDRSDPTSSTASDMAAQGADDSLQEHSRASRPQTYEAQHISKAALEPSSRHTASPRLLGGAASSDLSYTQLTALLGSAEAQEDSLSGLDSSSMPSTPSSSGGGGGGADMAGASALAEALVMQAEAAAAAQPEEPPSSRFTAGAELDALTDSQPEQGQVALPGLQDSAASGVTWGRRWSRPGTSSGLASSATHMMQRSCPQTCSASRR